MARLRAATPFLLLLGLIALCAAVRVQVTLADPLFDAQDPRGLLRSDPGLLFHFTQELIANGGATPADWGADPTLEFPATCDVPAMFTVGIEYVVAWLHPLLAGTAPLHVFCVEVAAVLASLALLGVFGLAFELTRSRWDALIAALACATLPAAWRTLGFVLIREDLSLPLYALHLWLFARAARTRGYGSALLASVALVLALATWHALGFVVALQLGALWLWYVWSGRNPFVDRRALGAGLLFVLGCVLVPVLRAKLALLSLPVQIAASLALAGALGRARATTAPRRLALAGGTLVASAAALGGLAALLPGGGDYRHVVSFALAKLAHLGQFPADPSSLDFDARLLWQGPFATMPAALLWTSYGAALVGLVAVVAAGLRSWRARDSADASFAPLALGALIAVVASWLVLRLSAVAALVLPVAIVAAVLRRWRPAVARAALAALVVVQLAQLGSQLEDFSCSWYEPPARKLDLRDALAAVERSVPPGEAVCADFMTATAVLAHTGRPAVMQPKYETARSRERTRMFLDAFFHQSPAELQRLIRGTFRTRWFLLDRASLWTDFRQIAGLRADAQAPLPGTAAWAMLQADPRSLREIPGFVPVYVTPAGLQSDRRRQPGWYVLFEVQDPGEPR
ncbi:MAG: hypothetical protein IPM29_15430 [Planctomycetes bacterium]|nr:hypothetical protein [Planctomycetota bacterium]